MSYIRDKARQDIQEDLITFVDQETATDTLNEGKKVSITKALSEATTSVDTVEDLQSKFSLPLIKKKLKLQ
jgi:transposase-like protein